MKAFALFPMSRALAGLVVFAGLAACTTSNSDPEQAPESNPKPQPISQPTPAPQPIKPTAATDSKGEQWREALASAIFNPQINCQNFGSLRAFEFKRRDGSQLVFLLAPLRSVNHSVTQLAGMMRARILEVTPFPENEVVRVSTGTIIFQPGRWETMKDAEATILLGLNTTMQFEDGITKSFSIHLNKDQDEPRGAELDGLSFRLKKFTHNTTVHEYLCERAEKFGLFDDVIADEAEFGVGSVVKHINALQAMPVWMEAPNGFRLKTSLNLKLNSNGTYELTSTILDVRTPFGPRRSLEVKTGTFKIEGDKLHLQDLGVFAREGRNIRPLAPVSVTLTTTDAGPVELESTGTVTFELVSKTETIAN